MKFGKKRWLSLATVGMLTFGCGQGASEELDDTNQLYWGESAESRCGRYKEGFKEKGWNGTKKTICTKNDNDNDNDNDYEKICGDEVIGGTLPLTAARRVKKTLCTNKFFNIYCGNSQTSEPEENNLTETQITNKKIDEDNLEKISVINKKNVNENIKNYANATNFDEVFEKACILVADKKAFAKKIGELTVALKEKAAYIKLTDPDKKYIDEKLDVSLKSVFKRKWQNFKSMIKTKFIGPEEKEDLKEEINSGDLDELIFATMIESTQPDRNTNDLGISAVIGIVIVSIWFVSGVTYAVATGDLVVLFFIFYILSNMQQQ